ncbi:MAG TPA: hypothetical protein VIV60_36680, partial [Polyangiaceae bacterium]
RSPGLGRRVADDIITRARRSAAEPEQISRWEGTLNQQTRGFLVDNPQIRATYVELDDVVRRLLTHCSELCICANASRQDALRLRALLQRLQVGDDELGYLREYFYVRRNKLAAALDELESAKDVADLRGRLLQTLERRANAPNTLAAGTTADMLRNTPGNVTGGTRLPRVTDATEWLRGNQGRVALLPGQVAAAVRGHPFATFADLRAAIWRAIADDPVLSASFNSTNRSFMASGRAPVAQAIEQTGAGAAQRVYNIHHIQPIEAGGAVYDLDNLIIVTPGYHDLIHY